MHARTALVAALVLGGALPEGWAQEAQKESELATAVKRTIAKGFTYSVQPAANIPDGFPQDRLALAGAPVSGEYFDGVYHARDGTSEVYRKGTQTAVRTERGWLPLERTVSPLKQDVAQAFDKKDGRLWKRGNVTAGRKSLLQRIQISHLVHRTNVDRLADLDKAFLDPKRVESGQVNGKAAVFYEGELSEWAANEVLEGPFAALVERGTLVFRNASGVGRVYLQDGFLRRIVVQVTGGYSIYDDTENTKRRGICTLDITADLTKHGETKVELPKEVMLLMACGAK